MYIGTIIKWVHLCPNNYSVKPTNLDTVRKLPSAKVSFFVSRNLDNLDYKIDFHYVSGLAHKQQGFLKRKLWNILFVHLNCLSQLLARLVVKCPI